MVCFIIIATVVFFGLLVCFIFLNKKNDWTRSIDCNNTICPVDKELKDNSSGFGCSFDYENDFKFSYKINLSKGNGVIYCYLEDQLIYSKELTNGINEYTSEVFSDKKGDFKCVVDYSDDAKGFEVTSLYTRTKKINMILHR